VSSLEGENRERCIDAVRHLDRRGFPARALREAPAQTQNDATVGESRTAEVDRLQRTLIQAQNINGGWGYNGNSWWTEPTALAILALHASGCKGTPYDRGCGWLAAAQRKDGGWSPHLTVHESTWVTSLAFLALAGSSVRFNEKAAIEWLKRSVNQTLPAFEQFIFRALQLNSPKMAGSAPWFPGTAGWVIPTSLTLLSLSRAARAANDPELVNTMTASRSYLLARRCVDGGWNHGGSSYRSENARSYPESTGLALLALGGVSTTQLTPALQLAESFLGCAESAEGLAWLQMGLTKQGRAPTLDSGQFPCRTIRETSLRLLALTADSPRNCLMAA